MKEKLQNKHYFKIIIFMVVLCIPIIYSFFYLKSYWDPYGKLEDMDVAIVNLDEGKDGENKGKELTDKLKDKNVLKINVVTQQDAEEGLKNEKYYATITIPSNFTETLKSAENENKQVTTITYSPNQKFNYLASQIINRVVLAAQTEVQNQVSKEVVTKLSNNLREVPDKMQEIVNGADKIFDGSSDLSDGLKRLRDGSQTLEEKYELFDDGIKSAYDGSKKLNDGTNKVNNGTAELTSGGKQIENAITQISNGTDTMVSVANQGIGQLVSGINDLDNGAATVKSGVDNYVDGVSQLSTNLNTYVAGVNGLNTNVKSLLESLVAYGNISTDPNAKALAQNAKAILDSGSIETIKTSGEGIKNGAKEITKNNTALKTGVANLKGGTKQLKDSTSGLNDLTSGMKTMQSALKQVRIGAKTLNNGLSELKNGTDSLKSGSKDLKEGLSTLSDNSSIVKDSLKQLSEGSKTAYDGSKVLARGTNTFKTEIENGVEDTKHELIKLDNLDEHVANSVELDEKDYGEVSSYGIAFTPLFLCIGLWVGALMCYVVLYYDQEKRFGMLVRNGENNRIIQNIAYLGISVLMGLVTGFLLKTGLKFTVVNAGIYYLECSLIAVTFMSIIQCLIRNLGDIGKFLGLIILVLQLASSGGTFPIPLIDKGFQSISSLLPMTYAIKIVKDLLIKTQTNALCHNSLVLIVFTVACLAITFVVDIIKMKKIKEEK